MKIAFEPYLAGLIRWILGLLLVWAAISKLANLQEFHGDLIGYRLPLPGPFLRGVAVVLPWVELLCGLMLLAKFQADAATLIAGVLFLVFVISTGQAWARGLNISCGCFDLSLIGLDPAGGTAKVLKSAGFAFVRACALLAGAAYLWRSHRPGLVAAAAARAGE